MMRGPGLLRVPTSRYASLFLSVVRVRDVGMAPVPAGCRCPGIDTRRCAARARPSGAGAALASVVARVLGIRQSAAERCVTAPPRVHAVEDAWSDTPHCQAQP